MNQSEREIVTEIVNNRYLKATFVVIDYNQGAFIY